MAIKEFENCNELHDWVGKEVAVTTWLTVTQQRIDDFAKASDDYQWIHVDPERAAKSPFGSTIAHGFLTMTLLSRFIYEAIEIKSVKMGINYGMNRLRFVSPVKVNSEIRARFTLASVEDLRDGVQMVWNVVVEIKGSEKPALIAEWLTRRHE
ncbi:MAG: MaoC family dehydratase [Pseudomonadota bacterium]|nr:MaoC family dehydratase [Pseudomonadota bacterium]